MNLYPANRSSRVGLRMIGPSGDPVNRRYYSPETGKELADEDMVRGYEWEDGRYIVVSDEELDRLAPEKSRDISLSRFVPQDKIPPIYFERSYFLTPGGGSNKAYRLLAETMEQSGRAGIATFVMRGKEYLVAIVSENGILRAETMRFNDEIRSPADVELPAKDEAKPPSVAKFDKIISEHWAAKLNREEMRDTKADQTLKLIERKRRSEKNVVHSEAEKETREKVVDLLSILKKSLAEKSAPQKTTAKRAKRTSRARG